MKTLLLAVIVLCLVGPVLADDLHGVDRILCSAVSATVCTVDGDCETDLPYNWNIPQFIEIDLAKKILSTTKASGLNRTSTADSVRRADGAIVVQGFENRRAYSFVIDAKTGDVVVAVAGELGGMTAFGSCTTLPASK